MSRFRVRKKRGIRSMLPWVFYCPYCESSVMTASFPAAMRQIWTHPGRCPMKGLMGL